MRISLQDKLNPMHIVYALMSIAFSAFFFGFSQQITLLCIIILFVVITGLNLKNGIYFLLLIVPFFLGNSKRPYFIVLEFFCYAIISVFCFYLYKKHKVSITIPYIGLIGLFFVFSCLSMPLNLKEFYFEIKGSLSVDAKSYLLHLFKMFCSSHEGKNIYWLRVLVNLSTSVVIYSIVTLLFENGKKLPKLFSSLFVVGGMVIIFGYLFLFNSFSGKVIKDDFINVGVDAEKLWSRLVEKKYINDDGRIQNEFKCVPGFFSDSDFGSIYTKTQKKEIYHVLRDKVPHKGPYLSLSMTGIQDMAISAFAYNRGYLGQYLIVMIPLFVYVVFFRSPKNKFLFVSKFILLLLLLFAIPLTRQRAGILVFFIQILVFFFLLLSLVKQKGRVVWIGTLVIVTLMVMLFCVDHFLRDGVLYKRIIQTKTNPGLRVQQWRVALSMAEENPLLGLGVGKYHHFFKRFSLALGHSWNPNKDYFGIRFVRTTAHNLYLHILAEQGILGLLSFLLIIFVIFKDAVKSLKVMDLDEKAITITLLVSLVGWLAYGMTQHMFYIRIMQIYFWIVLGFLTVLIKPYVKPFIIAKRWLFVFGICFVLLLCYRVSLVYIYYVP